MRDQRGDDVRGSTGRDVEGHEAEHPQDDEDSGEDQPDRDTSASSPACRQAPSPGPADVRAERTGAVTAVYDHGHEPPDACHRVDVRRSARGPAVSVLVAVA
jgi:hypothetical protein